MRGRRVQPREVTLTPAVWAWLLRDHRERAGIDSCAELARKTHVHPSYVTKVESLERPPSKRFAEASDRVLGTGGQLIEAWERVDWTTIDHPDWFRMYAAKEAEAVRIRGLHTERIPGLLQTAGYARALVRHLNPDDDEEEVERTVQARLRRQERFLDPDGPELVAIVDEGVIWQHVGGRTVMHAQLDHLLTITDRYPHIHLHVAQRELGERTGEGGFHLLSLPDSLTWVYTESLGHGRFIVDQQAAASYSRAYDRLRADALNGRDSATVIRRAMRELVNVTTTPRLAVDWHRPNWKTSSYSQGNGGECIEVATNVAQAEGVVPVRDSKDRPGPELGFSPAGWSAFVAAVRAGEFGAV
ncbi:Scr1 family TA system antitoxin-like transcriptional regulator [Kitasatospora sp. NPDC086801]|uniref:Scr1 family TA system antitoxin-like transcriptional regulator n=1 Tax=Kitasatospora sp. NPDC086801 TaxID=3364066 RepID=UPI003809E5FB